MLACWDDGRLGSPGSYELAGTPCAEIPADGRVAYFDHGVAAAFPDDESLVHRRAEAYQGRLVHDPRSGEAIGHVLAFDDQPDPDGPDDLVEIIARWTGLELSRAAAEAALRKSEARFRDWADVASDWFWETDAEHRFTSVVGNSTVGTSSAAPQFGDPEDYLGRTRWEAAGADLKGDPNWRAHVACLNDRLPFRGFVYERQIAPGDHRVFSISGKPIFGSDGAFLGYRGTGSDITALVEAERSAASAERRFVEAIEAVSGGFALFDADDRLVLCNERFRTGFVPTRPEDVVPGVAFEELVRTSVYDDFVDYSGDPEAYIADRLRRHREPTGEPLLLAARSGHSFEVVEQRTPEGGIIAIYQDVTERVRAEEALRASEERYALAMRGAGESLWDWTTSEDHLFLDPRLLRAIGLPDDPPYIGHRAILDYVHPDDLASYRSAFRELFRDSTRSTIETEFRLRMADGSYRWFRGRGMAQSATDGSVHRIAGSVRDITQARATQQALRESEERYALAMAGASEHLWDWRAGDDRIVTDPRILATMGLPEDPPHLDRHVLMNAIHPDDREYYAARLQAHLRGEASRFDVEYRLRMADGEYKWHRTRGIGLRDEAGRVYRVAGSTSDISERKAAEAALRQSERRYRHVFESGPVGMMMVDLDLRFSMVNDPFCAMLGHDREELIGRHVDDITPPDDIDINRTISRRLFEDGEDRVTYRKRYIRKDGEIVHADLTAGIIRDSHGQPLYGLSVVQDVTEWVRAEEALEERDARLEALQTELLRVSRASAMGEMASAIAHEVNQPLAAVMNYVQAARDLADSSRQDDPVPAFLDKASDQAGRAATIIRRLRDFFMHGQLALRPENINEVVEEAVQLALGGSRRPRISVDLDLADALPSVEIDRVQIQQVVVNLVRNAVEAVKGVRGKRIGVATARTEDGIEVSVRDNGPGIPAEIRERLFDSFVTSKKGVGMGIGLSISASIVQAHGGTLNAEDAVGGGTQFRFTVPGTAP